MEDPNQLEEKEVLGVGTWNTEYDIAEEEEERLLEDHELTVGKHGFPFESEPNFSDTEFQTGETEEDILDLGLNEDIIEYDEANSICQETSNETNKSIVQTTQGMEAYVKNQTNQAVSNPSNQDNHKSFSSKNVQHMNAARSFRFQRQPNFPIPVQLRNVALPRTGPPSFYNQRPHFEGPSRPLLGRNPTVMDYRGSRGGFLRPSIPIGCEPLFVQDFHQPGISTQRFQRHPFKDHHLVNHHQSFMEYDRNNSANRFFINPHYRGSVTVQNGCTSRIPPLNETRLSFSTSDNAFPPRIAFQNRHQRPPPGPNMVNFSRPTSMNSMRFVQPLQSNMPPPRLNGPANEVSPPRFKPPPQSLMDMVLPVPFGDAHLSTSYHSEHLRPQRFRFNSFEPPSHTYDPTQPVRFSAPPPTGSKRPATSEIPTAPLKQLRLGPTGNIHVLRSFPPPTVSTNSAIHRADLSALASTSTSLRQGPSPGVLQPQRPPVYYGKPPPPTNSPRSSTVISTTVSASTTSQSLNVQVPPFKPQSLSSNVSTHSLKDTEEASSEMKEYLEKMEEQRKKREEVLRTKEERRRQKLASLGGKDEICAETNYSTQQFGRSSTSNSSSMVPPMARGLDISDPNTSVSVNFTTSSQTEVSRKQSQIGAATVKENSVSPLRKTVLVKPTPTVRPTSPRIIPQAAIGVNRRYKIIIVKNKSGKILEKRRVPIDEPGSSSSHDSASCHVTDISSTSTPISHNSTRVSETVTIENLKMNVTEDYVWKLCQMFGTVQEVYPKLQEGKAIVRFSSSSGANNFLTNHQTPGICVRFL